MERVAAAPAPAPVPAVSTAQVGTLQTAQPRTRLRAVGLGMQVAPPTTPPLVQQLGHTRQPVPELVPGLVPMLVKAVAWVVRYDHEQPRMDHSWAMAPQVATKASHRWPRVTPLRVELRSSSQEMCRWRTCSSSCIDSSKRRSPPALPPPQCLVLLTLVPFLPPCVSHSRIRLHLVQARSRCLDLERAVQEQTEAETVLFNHQTGRALMRSGGLSSASVGVGQHSDYEASDMESAAGNASAT